MLRYLKMLVTGLAVTMIAGLIVLIWLIVMRFPAQPAAFPDTIALPAGVGATAITRGPGWLAVVTDDGRILIFGPGGQDLRQEIRIDPPR